MVMATNKIAMMEAIITARFEPQVLSSCEVIFFVTKVTSHIKIKPAEMKPIVMESRILDPLTK